MRSLPLIIGIASAWVPPLALGGYLLFTGHDLSDALTLPGILGVTLGMFYTHSFIYWYHRFPMHRYYRVPWTAHIKRSHAEHHLAFHRARLSIAPDKLLEPFKKKGGTTVRMNDMISQRWWVPCSIVAIHVGSLLTVMRPSYVMMFGFGLVIHYTLYDVSHWFTHVRPTRFGNFLERLPFIGNLWRLTVQVHDTHHSEPDVDFHFTPPWTWDMLCGTFATHPRRKTGSSE